MDITTLGGYTTHLSVCGIMGKKPCDRPQNLSFEKIYSFAKAHMIECSAYYGVKQLDEKPDFWDEWTKHISQMSAADAIQQIEFERLCECFEKECVNFIPLKGFPIKDCYPLGDMRRMSDLDIYVDDENKAHSAMLSLGYDCKSFGQCHHNTYYLKPVMNVEIHTRLSSKEKYKEYFDKLCENAISNSPNHRADFDVCDMLSFIVYHTYKHFSGGGCGIRVVLDLYLYSKKHSDEILCEKFERSLEDMGLGKFYESLIALGKVWFEDAEESELDKRLAEYIYTSSAYGKTSRQSSNAVVSRMQGTSSNATARRKSVFAVMFPDVRYMKNSFPYVRRCILLLPFAYVHRAVRGVFVNKKLSRIKAVATVSDESLNESYKLFADLGI